MNRIFLFMLMATRPIKLSWQNVLRNRRRAVVTFLIATFGVAAVLIAGGFADMTYTALKESSARNSGHVRVSGQYFFTRNEETPLQYGLSDHAALSHSLLADEAVDKVLPRLMFSGLISNGDKTLVFMGQGVHVAQEVAARGFFLKVESGSLADAAPQADNNDVNSGGLAGATRSPRFILGKDLAKNLHAQVGTGLTLITTTVDGAMNALDGTVSAIVGSGVPDVDERLVYVDLPVAQKLLNTQKISYLAVYLNQVDDAAAFLQARVSGNTTHDWQGWWEIAFVYDAVRALYNRIFGLLGLIIAFLVFFSVGNTLTMSVVERTREIGTLRALGAYPREIITQFVQEGALIGVLAAIAGSVMAVLTALILLVGNFQMPPPPGQTNGYPLLINLPPTLYVLTAVVMVLLCCLAAFFASARAVKQPITEALSHV